MGVEPSHGRAMVRMRAAQDQEWARISDQVRACGGLVGLRPFLDIALKDQDSLRAAREDAEDNTLQVIMRFARIGMFEALDKAGAPDAD